MRQIGTLPDESRAQTLSDYLLTQGIETKIQQESSGWEIWVRDEDRVERAREELARFQANPLDPRFTEAVRSAADIRRAEERADQLYRRRQVDLGNRMRGVGAGTIPVTIGLIAACSIVALVTDFGASDQRLIQALYIAPARDPSGFPVPPSLSPVSQGQLWRLATPVFLHFGPLHLIGNMMWLYYLGSQIEIRRGPLRYLALILVLAVLSNLGEYYLGAARLDGGRLILRLQPRFGGMSGVVFGLFGYIWMKMRFEPSLGFGLSQQAFMLSMLWFLFCFTGLAGSIANAAHTTGLLVGMALGAAPTLWRRLRN
jgi:GlpG protein